MKHFFIKIILFSLLLISCKNEGSLEEYMVTSQERPEFASFNISRSMIPLDGFSEEEKTALESVKKINLLGLYKKDNEAIFETEKEKLQNILKNSDFKELMRYTQSGAKIRIYYKGEEDNIDEIVAMAYHDEMGLGLARLLGDNMQPAKIIEITNSRNAGSSSQSFFKGILNSTR